jgi:hypothetical protein
MGKHFNTKLGKAFYLKGDAQLRKYVPITVRATANEVKSLLQQYHMVYVKPNLGSGGHGVIKAEIVDRANQTGFRYKLGTRVYEFATFDAFYQSLSRAIRGKRYLVQRGIRMLTSKGRPFDIRVMVQQNEDGKWEHTGSIGRIAHPKRIVTNCHFGGDAKTVRALLRPHMGAKRSAGHDRKLRRLGLAVANYMKKGYPRVKELGLDVGIDSKHRLWIFEVNTRPDPYLFKRLHNPVVFNRILKLARFHGRYRQIGSRHV